MTYRSFGFTHAIVRKPGKSIVQGLRAEDLGPPDYTQMCRDHAEYISALREAGAQITELPALEAYPDAVFVEDTALVLPEGAILMRPGAPTRMGEVQYMKNTLNDHFENLRAIKGPGTIEGGDILVTGKEILVGRSARTDKAGIAELRSIVGEWGYILREVKTPQSVLHFKTDCALLDTNTILSTHRLDKTGCFKGYRVIHTAKGEEAAANSVRFNQFVIMPAGFPKTSAVLRSAGFNVRTIDNYECAKLDGGMSCLSLRFRLSHDD